MYLHACYLLHWCHLLPVEVSQRPPPHQWRSLWSQWVRRVVQTLLILTPPPNCEYWAPQGCCSMSKGLNRELIFILFFLIRVWVEHHPWTWIRTDIPYLNLKHPADHTQTMMRYKHSIPGASPNTPGSQMNDIRTYFTNAASDARFQTHIDHIERESFRSWI